MKKEHPHAQVLRWIADGETVQFKRPSHEFADWADISARCSNFAGYLVTCPDLIDGYEFRLKPKTITVGDREIEAPVMSGPGYFISDLGRELVWFGDERDINSFADMQKNGRIFATPEAARAAQEAITALLTREPS